MMSKSLHQFSIYAIVPCAFFQMVSNVDLKTDAARSLFEVAIGQGFGDEDMSSVMSRSAKKQVIATGIQLTLRPRIEFDLLQMRHGAAREPSRLSYD
jgi:hypothetical protein